MASIIPPGLVSIPVAQENLALVTSLVISLGSMASVGTVQLLGAVFYAHHGVMAEEHRLGGRYVVDVEMDLDFEQAAKEDDLTGTVDYERIYALVKNVVMGPTFYLIERLAYLIAEAVMDANPRVVATRVTVRKTNPPVGGQCDAATATFRADRKVA